MKPLCCVSSTPELHGVAPGRSDRWTLGRHRPLVAGASVDGEPGQVARGLPTAARSPSLSSVTGGGRWRQPGFRSQRLARWRVVTTGRRRVVTTRSVQNMTSLEGCRRSSFRKVAAGSGSIVDRSNGVAAGLSVDRRRARLAWTPSSPALRLPACGRSGRLGRPQSGPGDALTGIRRANSANGYCVDPL